MNKVSKGLILSAVVAIALLATNGAYAQEAEIITDQQAEFIQIVALLSTVTGALISVGEGYSNRPEGSGFSGKELLSALITAITGSMFVINLGAVPEQTNGMTLIAVVVMYIILGYGSDKGLSSLSKKKKKN